MAPIFPSMDAPVIYTALKIQSGPSCVMSFHLIPHLPRLVTMVGSVLCVMKESEQFNSFLNYFINNQGRQYKLL